MKTVVRKGSFDFKMSRAEIFFLQFIFCFCLLTTCTGCPGDLGTWCKCSLGPSEEIYECKVGRGAFRLKTKGGYANFMCRTGILTGALLPDFPVGRNHTLETLILNGCAVSGAFTGVLRALGTPGARTVVVQRPRTPVTVEHLTGLHVEKLYLEYDGKQMFLLEGLSNLTSLKKLSISDAILQFTPGTWPSNDHLETLELLYSGVKTVPRGAFSNLRALKMLVISANILETLEKGAFLGLTNLTTLELNRNEAFHVLEEGILRDAPNLSTLKFTGAQLERVQTGAMEGLQHLDAIHIDTNLRNLTFEPKTLANLNVLREVFIQKTSLAPLPEDLFQGSTGLSILTLAKCGLKKLPRYLLRDQVNLERLNLPENQLSSLHEEQFSTLRKLKDLVLSRNQLEVLPEHIFSGLSNLRHLELGYNRLTTISEKTFLGVTALTYLSLSHNNLTLEDAVHRSTGSPFNWLHDLEILDLSSNSITRIFDDWRITLVQLKLLNLSKNKIGILKPKDTQFLRVGTVDLQHNKITRIDLDSKKRSGQFLVGSNPFQCDCNLYTFLKYSTEQLNFNIKGASCASPTEFNNTLLTNISTNLALLKCVVRDTCPENCKCLKRPFNLELDLNCRTPPSITTYPDPTSFNMTKTKLKLNSSLSSIDLPAHVYSLDLSNLNLIDVPNVPETLKELDLTFNEHVDIPEWILLRNITLYLGSNRTLSCDCKHQNSLRNIKKYGDKVYNFDKLVCEDGRLLKRIDVNDICEDDNSYATVTGAVLATVGVLSMLASILIYFYIQTIKEWIYSMGWNKFIVEEEIDGKTYDILMSYPDEYERYVAEHFVPILEDEGYSVCVRYRNWDIGDWIPTKAVQLAEDSRRTIVLISKEYLKSMACLEFQAALMNEKKGKRKRVLLVMTEDLNPDPELKTFLKGKKCLNLNDEAFWNKLRRYLPAKREKRPISQRLNQKTLNVLREVEKNGVYASKKSLER